jgi:hypothetical protein
MWQRNLLALLSRHGYDPKAPETIQELHARTGASSERLTWLLDGSPDATIQDLCLVSDELNVPPGELLSIDPKLLRIYSIDGSMPVTVALPPSLLSYITAASDSALIYAETNDGSYSGISSDTVAVCSRGSKDLIPGALYLMETESERFIRRCVEVRLGKKEAVFASGPEPDAATLVVNCEPVQVVSATSPLIMGHLLWTISRV